MVHIRSLQDKNVQKYVEISRETKLQRIRGSTKKSI